MVFFPWHNEYYLVEIKPLNVVLISGSFQKQNFVLAEKKNMKFIITENYKDALPENAKNIGILFLQETVPGFLKARWPWKK
ncbi:hypothetical protein HZS_6153 [Henneguya salminicola]|nr:hypothetical protein HZS_6153 [Henneguya salminicola]